MKKLFNILFFCFLITFFACESDSDNVIIVNGNQQQQQEEEPQDEEQQPNDSTENSGNENSEDTTATETPRVWDIFQEYSCYDNLSSSDFNILTWNIEWFPQRDGNTIERLADLISNTNADLIAVQEVAEPSQLENLMDLLPGWGYKYYDVRGDQELAYLYKEDEITSISDLSIIYPNNTSAFYRPPVIATVKHQNGQEITLFNIHLKCCGGSENIQRRRDASQLLKTYIDTNLANQKVIVLGDYNDEIDHTSTPFANFIADSARYYFADTEIAEGSYQYWSYPGFGQYGSHIDHILISNELFDDVKSISTLEFDDCISSYEYYISDHRPLMITIE